MSWEKIKEEVEKHLTAEEITKIYTEFLGKGRNERPTEVKFLSPFSEEKTPSFGVDPTRCGIYKCFSSGESGNIYTFLSKAKGIEKPMTWLAERFKIPLPATKLQKYVPEEEIFTWKEYLSANQNLKKFLNDICITDQTINKNMIGYNPAEKRFWFPIRENGKFVNVRKYDPFNKDYKIINYKDKSDPDYKYGEARIWPREAFQADIIYILEGEKDKYTAESLGLNAQTVTGGASTWNPQWSPLYKNKSVIIVPDNDEPGRNGALKKAKAILPYASQVKIVPLPVEKKGEDFNDYIKKYNGSKESFLQLVEDAPVFSIGRDENEKEYKVILAEASKAFYAQKRCSINNVIVSGRDTSPYQVPKKIKVTCTSHKKDKGICAFCPAYEQSELVIKKTDFIICEIIGTHSKLLPAVFRRYYCNGCKNFNFETIDYYTVDRIRMVPRITYNIAEEFEHVIRSGVYIMDKDDPDTKKIETNKTYNIKCVNVADPRSQNILHQIYDIEIAQTNIDSFELTPGITQALGIFRPEFKDGQDLDQRCEEIKKKLDSIYNEFSQASRIYGRNDLMWLYDMTFHSALTFDFQGKSIGKGWIETCAVGDSGVGKTSLVRWLMQHFRAGEMIDGESLTEAGLKGGLSQIGGQWQLQWGKLPINDRGMVVIDEASGLNCEDIAKLSNIRSSGECIITKVQTNSTRARVRIIWITNPRKANTGIAHYSYGVQVIADFFGKPEDVRRCDMAMTVCSGEIDPEEINKEHSDPIQKYTSELSRTLIEFAWSRTADQIFITKEAEAYILKKANEFGKKYSPTIPLVEASDVRNKIARFSVALAARLFNIDDKGLLIITPEFVEYVCRMMDAIYVKPRMLYDKYSERENRKLHLVQEHEVKQILHIQDMDFDKDKNIEAMLEYGLITRDSLSEIIGDAPMSDSYRGKIKALKHCNAIVEYDKKFKLTPALLDFLRSLQKGEDGGLF